MAKKKKYKVIVKWFETMQIGSRINIIEHKKVIKGKTRHLKRKLKKLEAKWGYLTIVDP
jgi:hypothetical protein